eukprot:TRINITY_DN2544_c0_g2_i2.p1 TRINITY_DN2544_c0_g2~~TRINITY_DN2544_c0_g2_i2.p1  ORF type:complete len:239 (+),score=-20.76 TRINITY_DN2544_c0_g2_i2:809-1525(+)
MFQIFLKVSYVYKTYVKFQTDIHNTYTVSLTSIIIRITFSRLQVKLQPKIKCVILTPGYNTVDMHLIQYPKYINFNVLFYVSFTCPNIDFIRINRLKKFLKQYLYQSITVTFYRPVKPQVQQGRQHYKLEQEITNQPKTKSPKAPKSLPQLKSKLNQYEMHYDHCYITLKHVRKKSTINQAPLKSHESKNQEIIQQYIISLTYTLQSVILAVQQLIIIKQTLAKRTRLITFPIGITPG